MARTLVEQVLDRVSDADDVVETNAYVTVTPDMIVTRDVYWPQIEQLMAEIGTSDVYDKERIMVCFDHYNSLALSPPYADHFANARRWVAEQGIEDHFYDVGRGGLGQMVMMERGYVNRPGMLVVTEENNYANMGVFGCLNLGVGWDVYVSIVSGRDYMRVPESVLVTVTGTLADGVTTRDVAQLIRHDAQTQTSIVNRGIEYAGSGLGPMTLDERETLLGATASWDIGMMEPDELALDALREKGGTWADEEVPRFDPEADYAHRFEYDLDQVAPTFALPGDMTTAVAVDELDERPVDVASIGSCAGSRYEDLEAVARVLRGRTLHPRVRMNVTPASVEVRRRAREAGIMSILEDAGATIFPPGCGQCFGYVGGLADGEVCVSTTQVNNEGRMGSNKADIYLASPYSVAAAAVAGHIIDPRTLLAA